MDNTYNPKIRLDIDTSQSEKSLNKILSKLEQTKAELTSKKEINVDATNALGELNDSIKTTKQLKQLLESIKNIKVDADLKPLISAIGKVEKEMKSLSNTMKDFGTAISATSENQLISAMNGIKTHLSDTLHDLKADLMQFTADNRAKITVEGDENAFDMLLARLKQIKEQIDKINQTPIDVRVTNKGFDKMIQNINHSYQIMNRIVKQTAANISKAKTDQKHLKDDTAATTKEENYFVRASAKALTNIRNMKNNTKSAKDETRKLGSEMKNAKNQATTLSQAMLKIFYTARGGVTIFENLQNVSYTIWQNISNIGQALINTVLPALAEATKSGIEMSSNLETARISYKLFFPNENPNDIVNEVKRRAIANPAFDSADLAKYLSQFAPLSEGDSKLALDAIEGIATMLEASGQDVSTYMQKLVTNTMQIVSTGKATARDWNEFLRATPVFEAVMAEITPALREKLGDEGASISKSDVTQLLHALQLVRNESSLSGVSEAYARTWSGLRQQMQETIQTTTSNLLERSGLYNTIKNFIGQSGRVAELLEEFLSPLYEVAVKFLNKINLDAVVEVAREIFYAFEEIGKFLFEALKEITGEANLRGVISKIINFVQNVVKGYITGLKDFINTIKNVMGLFGRSDIASALGWMASPAGQNLIRAAGLIEGIFQILGNLGPLLKAIKNLNIGASLNNLLTKPAEFFGISPAKLSSFTSKLGTVLTRSIQGALALVVGTALNEAIYRVTKNSHFGAAFEIGGGALGGALSGAGVGSLFGPAGTVVGGLLGGGIGGIISAINAGNKTLERIRQETEALRDELDSERNKLIKQALPSLTKDIQSLVSGKLSKDGLAAIDWESDAGAYASARIQEYFKNTNPIEWKSQDVMKLAYEAYNYQKLRQQLDDYTETEEFRSITTGGKFDPNSNIALRNQLAKIIITSKLNGAEYDYGDESIRNYEQIVKDYLNSNSMTVDQVTSLIAKYQELESQNKSLEEQFAEGMADWSENLYSVNDSTANLVSILGPLNIDINNLKTAIESLTGKIDGEDYGITLSGDLIKRTAESKKRIEEFNNYLNLQGIANPLQSSLLKRYHGGMIKPVYKASGGALGVDTVPVMAQRGEFVVRKSVVDKVGLSAMNALNHGDTSLASALMGRPSSISDNHSHTYSRTSNYNDRKVHQFIKIINNNGSGAGNSYARLGNRLALGGLI